ncbi:MlaD family protein [Mycobacterium vicinigordonae]|uniref:MCE family protein n=1 Tax=Mycobacterium vicinigordonae TaxID=1719132 RepID=A0A7D6HX85_9MYCO|nr:MlaD family protein [Mycobacterium vicinigordonae]QLL09133.1 MCE family protein [Mycobacterium vicinigordonae]
MPEITQSPRLLGAITLAIVVVAAAVVGYVYVRPPNHQIISFYTDDAASIRPQDTVRIAGIVVGTVEGLSLEANHVRVRASVDKNAFIGDQSQVQVRMLTVIGGYYITVIPLGNVPLGDRPIPKERVTTPYTLIQALTGTTKITENVAPKPIEENIDQLQQGLRGTNVDSVASVLNAGNAITSMLERQRGQITEILQLTDEYIDRLTKYRERLQEYIRKIAILEQALVLEGKAFADSILGIGGVLEMLKPVVDLYDTHRQDFVEKIRSLLGEFRTIVSRNGLVVRLLGRVHDRMERALDRQNNFVRPELLATDICIPTHGSPC